MSCRKIQEADLGHGIVYREQHSLRRNHCFGGRKGTKKIDAVHGIPIEHTHTHTLINKLLHVFVMGNI